MKDTLLCGDCAEKMRTLADNSIDAIVTDPPYGLAFMGAKWDNFGGKSCGNDSAEVRRQKAEEYAAKNSGAPRYANGHGGAPTLDAMRSFQSAMTPIFAEALRVAKPGAHLLAFGGTRTYHRLACAIEDAGWEVRDCIMWVYGSGFPKSMDVSKAIDKMLGAEREKVQGVFGKTSFGLINDDSWQSHKDIDSNIPATPEAAAWNGWGTQTKPAVEPVIIAVKPYDGDIEKAINYLKSMEDKLCSSNVKDAGRSLRPSQAVSSGVKADSAPASAPTPQGEEKERLTTTGKVDDTASAAATSALAQETESIVLNTILLWRRTLEGAYALTNKFTTSMVSSLTTDLKTWSCFLLQTTLVDIVDLVTHQSKLNASALLAENYFFAISAKLNSIRTLTVAGNAISQNEISPHLSPIVVARKPLEGTVAANVLKYGTGAINIDGCRVPTEETWTHGATKAKPAAEYDGGWKRVEQQSNSLGRFPANLVHDGSDEVLALFPESKGALAPVYGKQKGQQSHTGDRGIYGHYEQRDTPMYPRNDSGSAARFFYCAKASRSERGEGNDHCTVKPLALMRYLVRLVTRKGGIVLDPFMGSGTTGVAAIQEGMNFVGIERDPHYFDIAKSRVNAAKPLPPTTTQQELPLCE